MELHSQTPVRLLEILSSLSLAIDLGMGAPHSWVMRSSILSRHLARAAGCDLDVQTQALYVTLLRHVGCTSTAEGEARWLGDEQAAHTVLPWLMDPSDLTLMARLVRSEQPGHRWERLRTMIATASGAPRLAFEDLTLDHCATAQRAAEQWSLGPAVETALGQSYERWDGKGQPQGLRGPQVAPAARIAGLSMDIVRFSDWGGIEAAIHVVRHRRNSFYDPAFADLFLNNPSQFQPWLDQPGNTPDLLAAEPLPHRFLEQRELDTSLAILAEFADAQSSYRQGSSRGLSDLTRNSAELYLTAEESVLARRAALVQGLGRLTVSAALWSQARSLRTAEWERIRLVPYHTERILAASGVLEPLGRIASQAYERLDGSGYPRGLRGSALSRPSRLLAAATVYQALISDRPYRRAFSTEQARQTLLQLSSRRELDSDAVAAILGVADGRNRRSKVDLPFELTPRELDVLKLLAQGLSNKQMATELRLAPRTVDHHVERLYSKIHVRSRAEATQFALKNSLVEFK